MGYINQSHTYTYICVCTYAYDKHIIYIYICVENVWLFLLKDIFKAKVLF